MPELHPSDERLTDLALSDLDSRDQDALIAHLALCAACNERYSAIAGGVDGVLAAAPSMAPPPGFTSAVLAALGLDPGHEATPGPQHVLRASSDATDQGWRALRVASEPTVQEPTPAGPAAARRPSSSASGDGSSSRRAYLLAALAAVLALLVGAAGTALVLRTMATPAVSLAGAPLVTATGNAVGSVHPARYEGERVLVVSVAGRAGATYDCRVELADGTQQVLGSWTLPPDGDAAWVVDLPDGRATRMDLVAPSGRIWASAEL